MTIIEALQQQGVRTERLCLDSRRVQRGDIFVAYKGARSDGREFIADAVQRGAAAVLYEAEAGKAVEATVPNLAVEGLANQLGDIANLIYGRPSEKLRVVGVTGTNGKTSVSQWIAQAWNSLMLSPALQGHEGTPSQPPPPSGRGDQSPPSMGRGQGGRHILLPRSGPQGRCAVMGTLGNGFPGQLKESPNTTPDAITVHSGLAAFAAQGASACAMEVSSIGLDQGRVNGVSFETAVLTNLSRDHLDYHGDMSRYAAAKAKLFSMPGLKSAVLNLDDPFGLELAQLLRGKVATIGYALNADHAGAVDQSVIADAVRMTAKGVEFTIDGMPVAAAVIGRFNIYNLLAVFGCLRSLGFDATQAGVALSTLTPPPGRLQATGGVDEPLVVIDYAHTPDALDKALGALREIAMSRGGMLICVFGCGGDRDSGKRPLMGAVAERMADQVVITSDNPRSEEPEIIAQQIVAGMRGKPLIELDRARAIRLAIAAADVRDVVLLAGKGHEAYQEIAGAKQPFSDFGSARRALEQRS